MSMQEPTDNQLDGLFRKSAEEFDVPYDPAAWQALKNRLDVHDRLTVWEHVLRWGLPVLLLVVLTAGSWNANRKQARASQTVNSGVAMAQSAWSDKVPLPDSTAPHRQQPVDNGSLRSKETVSADLSKADGHSKEIFTQSVDKQRVVKADRADEMVTNTDESVVSSTTDKRSLPTTAGVTDRSSKFGKPTMRAGRSNSVSRPSAVNDAVPGVSASPAKAGKLAATMKRIGRTRSGTTSQRQVSQGVDTHKNGLKATLSTTDPIIEPERSFTKRQLTMNASGQSLVKKRGNGSRSLRAGNATVYSVAATDAPPVSAQANLEQPVQPALMPSFMELTSKPGQWAKPLAFIGRDVTLPPNPVVPAIVEHGQPVSTQPAPQQKGMSVRFVVSPDLSGIGLKDLSRPGTNVGLLLEYRMASRWTIQAGVLRSTKVYKASTAEYELPDYTAKWRVLPQSVDGRCNMLDIPLNLRYDVALRPRSNGQPPSRWFVSGGVTTYIMQKEDYEYIYAEADKVHVYPSAYPSMTGWHGKTGGYGFSQLNLSMGYEQALSRRLSWQVEPFVKVPLKGVGYFKIDLLSTGAFFSLRYKL
ncbi:MAG: hypothetical protein JWP57_179 [Spirosoma sp.]|nr:hypothetical protein [Spirosoma sp.]